MLKKLIENRKGSDWPTHHPHAMLRKAEANREAARVELTRTGIRRF